MYKVPTSFTAARDIVVKGTTYAKGAVLGSAVVGDIRKLNVLVAKRWIYPTPETHARRTKSNHPTPTFISPGALKAYYAQSVLAAPTNLAGTGGNTQVVLTWTASVDGPEPDLTDYAVQYKTTAGSSWSTFNDGVATSTGATVTGLTNGTSYDFRVRAVNAAGVSAWTSTISVTPPAAPAAPTITSITAGPAQLQVNFTAGADNGAAITNYQYSLDGGSYTAFSPADTTSPLLITGLTNGTTYTVRIKAVNSVGAGTASSGVTGTPTA